MPWLTADFTDTFWQSRNLNATFVAPTGDDRNDGHPKRPVRTAARGRALGAVVILAPGTYNDADLAGTCSFASDQGGVTFDGGGAAALSTARCSFTDVTIRNYARLATFIHSTIINCRIFDVPSFSSGAAGSFGIITTDVRGCLIDNCFKSVSGSSSTMEWVGNTFINSRLPGAVSGSVFSARDNIFDSASLLTIPFSGSAYVDFSTIMGQVHVFYSGGNQLFSTLELFLASPRSEPVTGKTLLRGAGTVIGFNNPAAKDFTLRTDSEIRNDSFAGSYIGAYGVGATHSLQSDVETATNGTYNVALGGWVPTDPLLDMVIEYFWKDYGKSWIMDSCRINGKEDAIERQTIDTTVSYETAAGVAVNTPTGSIAVGVTYWVSGYTSATYNGVQYSTDQFFVGVSGQTGYATGGAGQIVKVIEVPNARVFELKWSKQATTLTNATTEGNTRGWKRLIANRKPTFNIATGRTNGEVGFDPLAAEPLVIRWAKPRITVKANSLQ